MVEVSAVGGIAVAVAAVIVVVVSIVVGVVAFRDAFK